MDDAIDDLISAAMRREMSEAPDLSAVVQSRIERWERQRLMALIAAICTAAIVSVGVLLWALPGAATLYQGGLEAVSAGIAQAPYAATALLLGAITPWLIAVLDDPAS